MDITAVWLNVAFPVQPPHISLSILTPSNRCSAQLIEGREGFHTVVFLSPGPHDPVQTWYWHPSWGIPSQLVSSEFRSERTQRDLRCNYKKNWLGGRLMRPHSFVWTQMHPGPHIKGPPTHLTSSDPLHLKFIFWFACSQRHNINTDQHIMTEAFVKLIKSFLIAAQIQLFISLAPPDCSLVYLLSRKWKQIASGHMLIPGVNRQTLHCPLVIRSLRNGR